MLQVFIKNAFETILFSEARIRNAIRRLARRIDRDYAQGEPPIMVGILKGGAFFLVHLAQEVTIPAEVEFVQAASYGHALRSSGRVRKGLETRFEPRGRHILLVDDILDSGRTLRRLHEDFVRRGAASVRSVVLFDKAGARTVSYQADYAGLVTPDVWLTGFGLDYKGLYRGCRFAGVLKETGS